MRWGMVIDLKRCIGCYACQLSCKAEHGTPPGVFFARVLKQEEGTYPSVRQLFLPVLCNHCAEAPCVEACPTGASFQWEDGTVETPWTMEKPLGFASDGELMELLDHARSN